MAGIVDRRVVFLVLFLCFGSFGMADDKTLDIAPVIQQNTEWCWVATGQMILEYFDEPAVNARDYQCGIIGLYFFGTPCSYNCALCNVPAYSTSGLRWMLSGYPVAAAAFLRRRPARPIRDRESAALSFDDLKDEIDSDRPVFAGINPGGGFHLPLTAQHAVLIIGYNDNDYSLVVNDPFPYERFGVSPYQSLGGNRLAEGQYRISYRTFKDGLGWSLSLYDIVDPN